MLKAVAFSKNAEADVRLERIMKRIATVIFTIIVALLIARFFILHQVDPTVLDAIAEGTSEEEVALILGKPTSVETNASHWVKWHYDRVPCVYCEVVLDFDNQGEYRGRFHDH